MVAPYVGHGGGRVERRLGGGGQVGVVLAAVEARVVAVDVAVEEVADVEVEQRPRPAYGVEDHAVRTGQGVGADGERERRGPVREGREVADAPALDAAVDLEGVVVVPVGPEPVDGQRDDVLGRRGGLFGVGVPRARQIRVLAHHQPHPSVVRGPGTDVDRRPGDGAGPHPLHDVARRCRCRRGRMTRPPVAAVVRRGEVDHSPEQHGGHRGDADRGPHGRGAVPLHPEQEGRDEPRRGHGEGHPGLVLHRGGVPEHHGGQRHDHRPGDVPARRDEDAQDEEADQSEVGHDLDLTQRGRLGWARDAARVGEVAEAGREGEAPQEGDAVQRVRPAAVAVRRALDCALTPLPRAVVAARMHPGGVLDRSKRGDRGRRPQQGRPDDVEGPAERGVHLLEAGRRHHSPQQDRGRHGDHPVTADPEPERHHHGDDGQRRYRRARVAVRGGQVRVERPGAVDQELQSHGDTDRDRERHEVRLDQRAAAPADEAHEGEEPDDRRCAQDLELVDPGGKAQAADLGVEPLVGRRVGERGERGHHGRQDDQHPEREGVAASGRAGRRSHGRPKVSGPGRPAEGPEGKRAHDD